MKKPQDTLFHFLIMMMALLSSCSLEPALPPSDAPCTIATLQVNDANTALIIYSTYDTCYITYPHPQWGVLTYYITEDMYDCIGFPRLDDDYIVEIWDNEVHCEFVIPGLDGPEL